jgi:hypothetical protein
VKSRLKEINKELIKIEQTQTGSDINDNIMRLQNLEIKAEEIQADDETEEVLENIHQMGETTLPLNATQLAGGGGGAKALEVIADEIIEIAERIGPQIVDLDKQLAQLEQSNNNRQFAAAVRGLKIRSDTLAIATHQIVLDLEGVRGELEHDSTAMPDTNETEEILAQNNGSTTAIIDQLFGLNNSLNDSQLSASYVTIMERVRDMQRVQSALSEAFEAVEQLNASKMSSSGEEKSDLEKTHDGGIEIDA